MYVYKDCQQESTDRCLSKCKKYALFIQVISHEHLHPRPWGTWGQHRWCYLRKQDIFEYKDNIYIHIFLHFIKWDNSVDLNQFWWPNWWNTLKNARRTQTLLVSWNDSNNVQWNKKVNTTKESNCSNCIRPIAHNLCMRGILIFIPELYKIV